MVRRPSKSNQETPRIVVGIGMSASGVISLKKFFANLKHCESMAFVIMYHREDGSDLLAHDLLGEQGALTLQEIKSGTKITSGSVYYAPTLTMITLDDGRFGLEHTHDRVQGFTLIDSFFRSLAKDQGQRAVGIVLSGEGSDGALGLKSISDHGGMTLVQLPESAEFPSMPINAIATGAVDHVTLPDQMPSELESYNTYLSRLLENDGAAAIHQEILAALGEICEILLKITKHDFKHYKTSTLVRRIQRRMQVLQYARTEAYVERLRSDGKEVDSLFKELLINVTWFFRDPEAFATLKTEVLEKALKVRRPDQKYRIWVAGCSTGEEVYSLAIIIREILATLAHPPEVQIIATDIDEAALNQARKGSYPSTIVEHVSEERLKKFFIRKAGRYHVSKELREIVLFSSHNLINDPPFSQLDLITCRNVLIYLGSHLQKKLIPVFHYALRTNGCLFLGTSESLASHKELFRTVSARHRIAQRKATSIRPPGFSTVVSQNYIPHSIEQNRNHEADLHLVGQRIVLDEFAPKYAIVNEDCQVVSVSSGLATYLDPPEGTFQNNLMKIVKPGLRVALRATFTEAKKHKRKVTNEESTLQIDNDVTWVGLTVQPMPQLGDESSLFMVIFQYLGLLSPKDSKKISKQPLTVDNEVVDQLERELNGLREDLDRSIQEIEASNEELKSSNEELLSMNEELQSANEELEASKEEVQISNDALQRSNTDLENLLASTEIGTLFLDKAYCIQNYTPQLESIYNITRNDIGRPITHFTHRARSMHPYPELRTVGLGKIIEEKDLELIDGRWMLRRISPYRTIEGEVSGLVVTFIDITHLRLAESKYRELADSMPLIVYTAQPNGEVDYFNARWYEYTGFDQLAPKEQRRHTVVHPDDLELTNKRWAEAIQTASGFSIEYRLRHGQTGQYRWFMARAVPAKNDHGEVIKWYGSASEIHSLKEAQFDLAENEKRLDVMFNTSPAFMAILSTDQFIIEKANVRYLQLVGHREIIGLPLEEALPEMRGAGFIELMREVMQSGVPFVGTEVPVKLQRRPGAPMETRILDFVYQRDDSFGRQGQRILVHGTDVTEKVNSRLAIENERENFRNLFKQTPEMVCILSGPEHLFEFSNEAHQKVLGFNPVGKTVRQAQPESLEVHGLLDGVYQTGKTAELVEIPVTVGSRLRYFNLTYAARKDTEGKIDGVMILGTEITDQVDIRVAISQAKLEADAAREAAEAANESKTRFLANMSHEIRTPLAAILGFSELLQGRTTPGDSDAAFQLERISRNATQLRRLIDELLDLSKIEAGRIEMESVDFDLGLALEDVMATVGHQARDKGLNIGQVKKGKVPAYINTDPTRFRQILTNIIGNAVKFTEKGRVEVEIEQREQNEKSLLLIRVKDTGIGLSPQQQKKIFEPFVQADPSVTRKYGGTGLGLILSKRLAQLMGGDLVLEESALDKGSSFLLTLEIGDIHATAARTSTLKERTMSSIKEISLKGRKILVVDDAPDNQIIIRVFLGAVGAEIVIANNGLEAVEMMRDTRYDVVLMDIQMPIMDGYRALQMARQMGYSAPIVALTAHAMKEEKDRCLEAGFTDYISKPVDRTHLIQRVAELCGFSPYTP